MPAVLHAIEDPVSSLLEVHFAKALIDAPRFEVIGTDPHKVAVDPDLGLIVAAHRDPSFQGSVKARKPAGTRGFTGLIRE